MDITYRPANPEDLEEAERVAQQSGNALRVAHGGQPSPPPMNHTSRNLFGSGSFGGLETPSTSNSRPSSRITLRQL